MALRLFCVQGVSRQLDLKENILYLLIKQLRVSLCVFDCQLKLHGGFLFHCQLWGGGGEITNTP